VPVLVQSGYHGFAIGIAVTGFDEGFSVTGGEDGGGGLESCGSVAITVCDVGFDIIGFEPGVVVGGDGEGATWGHVGCHEKYAEQHFSSVVKKYTLVIQVGCRPS
jgi:hypothetical protein